MDDPASHASLYSDFTSYYSLRRVQVLYFSLLFLIQGAPWIFCMLIFFNTGMVTCVARSKLKNYRRKPGFLLFNRANPDSYIALHFVPSNPCIGNISCTHLTFMSYKSIKLLLHSKRLVQTTKLRHLPCFTIYLSYR